MAQFYGTLQGQRGEATRLGSKASGLTTTAAGWKGAIKVNIWHDEEHDQDQFEVRLTPWSYSGGEEKVLAQGVLDARNATRLTIDRKERWVPVGVDA